MKIDTFETLEKFRQVREQLDPGLFITALIAALLAAYAAAGMYRFFYERRGTGSQVHRAFPLLAIAITTLFIGVQLSIPLSLGLLGSLSIIRFRTPIKEPEEVGFIMLVIAASISAATFNFLPAPDVRRLISCSSRRAADSSPAMSPVLTVLGQAPAMTVTSRIASNGPLSSSARPVISNTSSPGWRCPPTASRISPAGAGAIHQHLPRSPRGNPLT